MNRENYLNYLESTYLSNTEKLEIWAQRFQEDPFDAFDWSQSALRAAAENFVIKEIRAMVKSDKMSEALIIAEVHNIALSTARRMHSVTSSDSSNALRRELCVAWATFAERIDNWLAKGELE